MWRVELCVMGVQVISKVVRFNEVTQVSDAEIRQLGPVRTEIATQKTSQILPVYIKNINIRKMSVKTQNDLFLKSLTINYIQDKLYNQPSTK